MRDYQRTISNPYHMPNNLYKQTLAMIRDYYRLKEEYDAMMQESAAPPDGQPKGNKTGDPTGSLVIRLENTSSRINAIEKAKRGIPPEYIDGIWKSIQYREKYPQDAGRNTYGRWKAKFIWLVAHYMEWI